MGMGMVLHTSVSGCFQVVRVRRNGVVYMGIWSEQVRLIEGEAIDIDQLRLRKIQRSLI